MPLFFFASNRVLLKMSSHKGATKKAIILFTPLATPFSMTCRILNPLTASKLTCHFIPRNQTGKLTPSHDFRLGGTGLSAARNAGAMARKIQEMSIRQATSTTPRPDSFDLQPDLEVISNEIDTSRSSSSFGYRKPRYFARRTRNNYIVYVPTFGGTYAKPNAYYAKYLRRQ